MRPKGFFCIQKMSHPGKMALRLSNYEIFRKTKLTTGTGLKDGLLNIFTVLTVNLGPWNYKDLSFLCKNIINMLFTCHWIHVRSFIS